MNLSNSNNKSYWTKILSAFFFIALFSSYLSTFAIGQPYNPGETLDPSCAPGDTNCTVASGSQWTTTGSDIGYLTGNVGIGTTTPTAMLDMKLPLALNYTQSSSVSGPDDATYSGPYMGTSDSNSFYVSIDSTGTPDTFSFSDDNGDCTSQNNVPITSSSQLLCDGISITFATDTGHTSGDQWTYYVYHAPTNPIAFNISDANGNNYFTVNAGAPYSTLLGIDAGNSAINANGSNFFGYQAGYQATEARYSNFLGQSAGYQASSASDSNFIGVGSGSFAASAYYSNFLGYSAGYSATNANNSNFFGNNAGYHAILAQDSNFIGVGSGEEARYASYSNFLGFYSGYYADNADNSNFVGYNAGLQATNADHSNFIGYGAGNSATNAHNSNFIGIAAGQYATNAGHSIFLGSDSGSYSSNAANSIFIGNGAGNNDGINNTGGGASILIGNSTHTGNFTNSIAIGTNAQNTATNQFLIGQNYTQFSMRGINYFMPPAQGGASTVLTNDGSGNLTWASAGGGSSQWTTSGSNIYYNTGNVGIGTTVPGAKLEVSSAGDTATSYSARFQSSGNVNGAGGILFDQNSTYSYKLYTQATGFGVGSLRFAYITQATGAVVNDNILVLANGGVGVGMGPSSTPTYTLDVGNSSVSGIVARFTNSTSFCTISPTGGSVSCASDISLKKNITNLGDNSPFTLTSNLDMTGKSITERLTSLIPVTYNWNGEQDTDTKHAGFIAQQVQQVFPELVSADPSTNLLSLNTIGMIPYMINTIQAMDLRVKGIETISDNSTFTSSLKNWFASATNGIGDLYAKIIHSDEVNTKNLCVTDESGAKTCITKSQLDSVLQNIGQQASSSPLAPTEPSPEPTVPTPAPIDEPQPTPTTPTEPATPEQPAIDVVPPPAPVEVPAPTENTPSPETPVDTIPLS